MVVAEVRMTGRVWYAKLIGPAETVERWEESVLTFVREAK